MSAEPVIEPILSETEEATPAIPATDESREPVIGGTDQAPAVDAPGQQERGLAERLRAGLLATAGDLPPEAVSGETLDEVAASFAAARPPQGLGQDRATAVPAGAPGRLGLRQMTAFEKIREGLARR